MTVTVDEFEVADPADPWTRAGFSIDSDAVCRIGGVRIRLGGRGRGAAPAATSDTGAGIIGWSLRGLPSDVSLDDLDGVPTTRSAAGTCCCRLTWIGQSNRSPQSAWNPVGNGTANSADDRSARSSSGSAR